MSTMLSLSASYYSCSSSRFFCPFSSLFFFPRAPRIPLSRTRRNLSVVASDRENGVFRSPEIAKSFDFAAEERIYNWWESQGYFKPNFDRGSDPFVIPMPPPNVTGSLHMGHAMFVTLEDIMIRYNRMKGKPTLWLPGTDHAGIATQLVVERMLASEGIKRTEMNRDEFTKRVWQWKEKYIFISLLVFLPPAFFDFEQSANKLPISKEGTKSHHFPSQEMRIWNIVKSLVYGGTIANQIKRLGASCDWSREHFTLDEQLSQAVVEAFVRLHEKGLIYQGSYMVNWSPTLQTAVSDLEVEYSEESGFLYYIKYRVAGRSDFLTVATTRPETLFGDVALAVHPEVSADFNCLYLLVTLAQVCTKLRDDRYSKYIGMMAIVPQTFGRHVPIIDNKHVDKDFGAGVLKISPGHDHDDYLLARKLGLPILNVMNKDGTLNDVTWVVQIYNHWLSNIKDWCISRQLWWGHRIPVWYIAGKDNEEEYIVARNAKEALEKANKRYGKDVEIYQDPDVLDTWFSSALWPFSTLGWPDICAEDFKRFYPTTMLETGHDILFFWVARMVMMGIEFTGKVPFSYVYLHGLIRDSQGRKMSKTLGNVVDPLDTIKEFGTDALRFTLALGTAGQDLNLSTERLTSNKAFTNKLWNAGKFILQNLPNENDASAWEKILSYKFDNEDTVVNLPLPECWVVSKLHLLIESVTASYDKFYFGEVGRETYDFFWADFADWYIEASKGRLYHSGVGDNSVASVAQAVLLYTFENILKVLHPFMPFVTEELWQALPNRKHALIVSPWPETQLPRDTSSIKKFENLQALVRVIRNARAEYVVEPAKRISASVVANNEVIDYIAEEREVLALLSRLDLQNLEFTDSSPGMILNFALHRNADQSVHVVAGEGLEAYLPLADMVDISAEVERLSKRLSKMQKEYDALKSKLNSPQFVKKAPEDVVLGVQEKATEAEEKINLTKKRLEFLRTNVVVSQ
ncbi:hypothetical protein ACSQ67_008695 [Phaseolus vulgaris]